MRLRRATPEELPEVGELTVAAYEEFLVGHETDYREQLADARSRLRDAELWVAAEGGTLLGTVTYCPPGSPWRELAADDAEGEFRMLAVRPSGRDRGVGRALVALCERRARRHGAGRMVLSSMPGMAAAHRVYGLLGYTRDPHRDWSPVAGVELVAFVKELS